MQEGRGGGAEVQAALSACRLLALDVDGVLTDGSIVYAGEVEQQVFHVRDGQGLVWLRRAGVELAWITGRGCEATRARAAELGVRELHMRVSDKAAVLRELQQRLDIAAEATVAMGDDLADLGLAQCAALFAAPADADARVRARAQLTTTARGGRGAVRELCEAILEARGMTPGAEPGTAIPR